MSIKEKIVKAVADLPEETNFEEAMERLYFLYKVEKGLAHADEGRKVSHEEAEVRMSKWLK